MITTAERNDKICICLEGRIDTTNAGQVEKEIFAALEKTGKPPRF